MTAAVAEGRTRRTPAVDPRPVVFDARVITGAGGGPEKTILNSPRFLDGMGYRMLCGYLTPPNDPGFDVVRKKAAAVGASLVEIPDRGAWDWRVITNLLAVCRRERVAVWHGHDYKTNALGLLLQRFHRMRLVTTVHGWVQHTTRTPLYYRVDRFCLPRYERVYCVSDDLYAAALGCGVPADRCVLLENGIDADDYRRTRDAAAAKAALGLPASGTLVGAVGRLSEEKAFDVLIRAMHALATSGRDVRLVVVGEGHDRPRLEGLVKELGLTDRVSLPGWRTDVRGYFEAFDLFALSSLREGLPNVVLEAMALEVPVVATAVNGVPRLVRDGDTGLLVPAGDPAPLAAGLGRLIDDAGLRERVRQAARELVEGPYSFHRRMRALADDYDRLLAGS